MKGELCTPEAGTPEALKYVAGKSYAQFCDTAGGEGHSSPMLTL